MLDSLYGLPTDEFLSITFVSLIPTPLDHSPIRALVILKTNH